MKLKRKPKQNIWFWVFTGAVIIEWAVLIFWFTNLYQNRNLSDEQQLRQLYQRRYTVIRRNTKTKIGRIYIENNWAVGETYRTYTDTGKTVPAGPGIMVFHNILGRWYSARGWRWLEERWIDLIPTSLLPESTKIFFR